MIWYFIFMITAAVGLFFIIVFGEERLGCFVFGAAFRRLFIQGAGGRWSPQGQAVTSVVTIAIGMGLLAVSLAARYVDAPYTAFATSWAGVVWVVVGTGKLFFLDG